LYAQHKTAAEIAAGIAAGRLHQGVLRASRFNPFDGWVSSEAVGQDILISGRIDMNRAIDGECVFTWLGFCFVCHACRCCGCCCCQSLSGSEPPPCPPKQQLLCACNFPPVLPPCFLTPLPAPTHPLPLPL
jgi:hypothetical protein